jgi:pSer/pThr/pTyr-binding forkhead associated (FHA) protein
LTIITSQTSSNGIKLLITKDGLKENSLRNKNDGIVYFGYLDDIENNNENENTSIDYLLPQKRYLNNSDNNNEFYSGRYFQISYNPLNNNYYLRDLGNGLGTFVKITDKLYLKDNILINIGDSYFVINFNPSVENTESNIYSTIESKFQGIGRELIVKTFTKIDENGIQYNFSPEIDKIIKIGRKKNGNDIELEDRLVSKFNSIIKYEELGWVIYDGYEVNVNGQIIKHESTNGTWVLAIEDTLIYNEMVFKANFNLFCCNIIKEEN